MSKKVFNYTEDEKKLYTLIENNVKKANSRINKLEQLGVKDAFSLNELRDMLGSQQLRALTKTGKISLKGGYNLSQLLAIQKATENFLDGVSTIGEIKKIQKEYEEKLDKPLNLKQLNTLYQAQQRSWEWLESVFGSKETWIDMYPNAKSMSSDSWIEYIEKRLEEVNEEYMREDIEALYIYFNK